jgi:hypothetical protein
MATCKECVHVEVCRFKDLPAPLSDSYIRESECIEKRCGDFKDRSRFVELPCKLGDEFFYTTMGKIHQAVVDRIELYDEGVAIITTDGYCPDSSICYHTQEEAEQALKARSEQP